MCGATWLCSEALLRDELSHVSQNCVGHWEAISGGYQTDTIYTDYSAAFQSVNHTLISHKLEHSYMLRANALKWFVSYLTDRRQRVIVNGKTSAWKPVISGVPEGSILAPLIFSLFINDLPQTLDSECLMYADDVKIFRKISTPSDGRLLQDDLERLSAWSVRWGLTLNPSKCKSFTITLRRTPVQTGYYIGNSKLDHVEEIRDLGVILDKKLTFAAHVDTTVKRGNRAMGLLIRSFQSGSKHGSHFNRTAVVAAYFSNVRSILEYSSVIWAGVAESHARRVDRVQHKFLMWLLHNTRSGNAASLSYCDLCRHFKIPTLAARRDQHDLLFLKNIFCNKLDTPRLLENLSLHAPTRSTRLRNLLNVPHSRVNTVQHGMFSRLPMKANEFLKDRDVEADIFHDSHITYKQHVIKYIRKQCGLHQSARQV